MSLSIHKNFLFHDAGSIYAIDKLNSSSFFFGGGNKFVNLFDLKTNTVKQIVNTGSTIYSIKCLADYDLLLTGTFDGGLYVIDLLNKKELHHFVQHQNGIFDIQYSRRFNKVFTAGGDGCIGMWNINPFSNKEYYKLTAGKIRSLCFNDTEEIIAIGCGDGTVRIHLTDSFKEVLRFEAHNQSVNVVIFHPENKNLITVGKDAHLKIWSPEFKIINSIPAHNYAIYSIAFSPDMKLFATGSRDKTIKIWDAKNHELLTRIDKSKFDGHSHSVNKVLWLEELLISISDDKSVLGWDIGKKEELI
jgi:WD40 repeat protein